MSCCKQSCSTSLSGDQPELAIQEQDRAVEKGRERKCRERKSVAFFSPSLLSEVLQKDVEVVQ